MTISETYLRHLSACPPMDPAGERAAALRLAESRVNRWVALLSYAPLVPAIVTAITGRIEIEPETSAHIHAASEAAARIRLHRRKADHEALRRHVSAAARELAYADLEVGLAEEVVRDLEGARRGPAPTRAIRIRRVSSNAASFRTYVRRCREAHGIVLAEASAFANANLRLVVRMARAFEGRGLAISDLIQDGNLGLLKAVERFDIRRGFRFSTYAAWWIRHGLSRGVYNTGRQVRLPVHIHGARSRVRDVQRRIEAEHGRAPTDEELAEGTGFDLEKLAAIQQLDAGSIVPVNGRDEEFELFDDGLGARPGQRIEESEQLRELGDALVHLAPMEAEIIRRRFGLDGVERETLAALGDRYALSRERIRQIQVRALSRLREHVEA